MFKRRRTIKLKAKRRIFNNTRRRISRKTNTTRLLGRRLKQTTIRMGETMQDDENQPDPEGC